MPAPSLPPTHFHYQVTLKVQTSIGRWVLFTGSSHMAFWTSPLLPFL